MAETKAAYAARCDKTNELYFNQLYEQVQELRRTCEKCKIPMVLTMCLDPGDKESEKLPIYKNIVVSPFEVNVKINPDRNHIANFFKIVNGFVAVPEDIEKIDTDEFAEMMKEFEGFE